MRLPTPLASIVAPPLLALYTRSKTSSDERGSARLRAILRAHPYWAKGHLQLGEAALAEGDVATAYASAQAARTLCAKKPRAKARALHLLGRCYLARGDWQSALDWLNQSAEACAGDHFVQQDRAAALMLGGMHAEALQTLSSIPAAALSGDGKAALDFLRGKVDGRP